MSFLVDLTALMHNTYIESDVNEEKLTVTLKRVQDFYVEPVIGTPLFKRLLSDVENDTLTGDYLTLVNTYILPYLYVGCEVESVVHQNYKIRNKNVGKASDQYVQANDLSQNNNLSNNLDKHLVFYKNRLIGYLCDNSNLFAEYCLNENKSENLSPENGKDNSYNSSISFI